MHLVAEKIHAIVGFLYNLFCSRQLQTLISNWKVSIWRFFLNGNKSCCHEWMCLFSGKLRNPADNTLELYNVLAQVKFTTSKPKLKIYYVNICIWITATVVKQFKTLPIFIKKLRKIWYQRFLFHTNIAWSLYPVPSILSRNRIMGL